MPGAYPRYRPGEAPEGEVRSVTPKSLAWPHHSPDITGGLIPPAVRDHGGVRWPQGDIDWLIKVCNLPADPVPLPPLGTGGLIESGQLALFGGSVINSATTAATLTIYDGMDAKGGLIAQITVPASGNTQINLPRAGVICEMGLFAVVAGGLVTGPLYVAHLWKYPFTPPGE